MYSINKIGDIAEPRGILNYTGCDEPITLSNSVCVEQLTAKDITYLTSQLGNSYFRKFFTNLPVRTASRAPSTSYDREQAM